MVSKNRAEKNDQILKKSILLVERNASLCNELHRILNPFYRVILSHSIEQATKKIEECAIIDVIITNVNLHEHDHSLMDGFSLVRISQFLNSPIPVIVYTDDLHPLALIEAQSQCTFKILDQSHPSFKKNLLNSIFYILKIFDWKSQFEASIKNSKKVRELLKEIPFVSPIQWNHIDENLYDCFFMADTQNPSCYANSWAYICQAARNNGHKFFNGSCLITIETERIDEPDALDFVIINPIGQGAAKRTLELAERLKKLSGKPVKIKKVSKTQEYYFLNSRKCYIHHPKSTKLEDQFDDIHPQTVVNLKAFLNHLTSNELYVFQRNLKKFSQRNYMMRTTEPELFDDFWDVVLKWKRSFIQRYEEHGEFTDIPQNDDYYINPYFSIFEYFCKQIDNKNTLSSIIYVDNIPVGFSFLSKVSNICMGMYANICDTDYEGLSEFMLYQNFSKAYWSGYKYVNLGGTESKYLYKFYNKYNLSYKDEKSFEIKTNYLFYE